jgi:cytochrome c1
MRKIFKTLLSVILIILLLIIAFATYVSVRGIPKYEAKKPNIKINSSPERIIEGKRLASMLCKDCHFNPETGTFSGLNINKVAQVDEFGEINSANITADKEHGIGAWTDGELMWMLRTGINRTGQYTPPYMPKFVNMSDEDLAAVISFLRSDDTWVKPNSAASIPSKPSFLTKFLSTIAFFPNKYPEQPIIAPDSSDMVKLGKYLVTGKYDCYPCHSADFKTMNTDIPEQSAGFMGGGNPVGATPNKKTIYSSNITSDAETGIGNFTLEQFDKALRSGIRPDGTTNRKPMMPYAALTDQEVKAIYTYLKSIPAIKNKVERSLDQ